MTRTRRLIGIAPSGKNAELLLSILRRDRGFYTYDVVDINGHFEIYATTATNWHSAKSVITYAEGAIAAFYAFIPEKEKQHVETVDRLVKLAEEKKWTEFDLSNFLLINNDRAESWTVRGLIDQALTESDDDEWIEEVLTSN